MTFTEAADELMARGVTLAEIGEALGVAHTTARAFRLDPASPSHRKPPAGWEGKLAALAERRGVELVELAGRLRGGGG